MKYAELISKMTLREKAEFCSGIDFWHLAGNERLGIPSIMVCDGPHGLRKKKDKKGKGELLSSVPAVCFPTACLTACSWDPDLLREMGKALGEECLSERVSVILGPGVNIKRSPLCGRNFEYFSEDPFLTGKLAAALIDGIQSKGVGTAIKHYAANNQETRRMTIDTIVDERALREIYLAGFEEAVVNSKPWTVMNAYNRLNGTYCSEHKWLLTDVLRNEWGFRGFVMTDWGAENDRVEGLKAGQELEMPTSSGLGNQKIVEAVQNGELDEDVLDRAVNRLLHVIFRASENLQNTSYSEPRHHELARRIASESMVLLKNEDSILPISKSSTVAVIGEMARSPRYQGAGSSLINPTRLENAFDNLISRGVKVKYAPGYDKTKDEVNKKLIEDAVACAKNSDAVLVFAGLTDAFDSEGFDRTHIDLPKSHSELIKAVAAECDNVIVVLAGGSAVAMPWLGDVKAVLHTYLAGQAGGKAVVDVLLGDVNPSGKLAETYACKLSDIPSSANFPGTPVSVEYRESIYVGYRYFDTAGKDVLFPFGFGLSYTEFEYSGIKLSAKKIKDTDTLKVTFKVKNVGKVAGAEVAQLYVSAEDSPVFRPEKELKGFKKVFLEPGEEKTVEIELDKRSFAYYNVKLHDWHAHTGKYNILVGASSRDIRLKATVQLTEAEERPALDLRDKAPSYYAADVFEVPDSEFETILGRPIPPSVRPEGKPIDLNSTLEDANTTKAGKVINNIIGKALSSMGEDSANENMMKAMALQIPIRCFVSMSMGVFTQDMAEAFIDILNGGSVPKGIGKMVLSLSTAIKNIGTLMNSI